MYLQGHATLFSLWLYTSICGVVQLLLALYHPFPNITAVAFLRPRFTARILPLSSVPLGSSKHNEHRTYFNWEMNQGAHFVAQWTKCPY